MTIATLSNSESKQEPRVVLCMKWGTLYTAEYVNVLHNACKRHISTDFRFVCLTDDDAGFQAGIESYPIPNIGLEEPHYYHGAWPKISVFCDDLYGLQGRALFIDLDTVIWGSLDELFNVSGELVAINNALWDKDQQKAPASRTMSSVFSFDLGQLGYVVSTLQANRDALIKHHDIEQVYLHHVVKQISYWQPEWLVSFKYHLRQPLLRDRFYPPRCPAEENKLIIFHGNPRPIELIRPANNNWGKFPHYGKGSVDWMVDYWCEMGGSV